MKRGLTAKFISEVTRAGKYHDARGCGLFLAVGPKGRSKSFVQRVVVNGKRRDIGLGSVRWLTLGEAREIALENWKVARRGGDPVGSRRSVPTFEEMAELVIAQQRAGWRDGRSEAQWRASLRDYVFPRFGDRRVDQITTADVLAALQPHWHDKHVTMQRTQKRISKIMKFAIARGFRTSDPAGPELTAALPANGNKRKKRQKAIPHGEVGAALAGIRAADARPAVRLALEFAVLTAARSGEVRGAVWNEIDLDAATWTVPATRIKGGIEHRVPLSARALEILGEARALGDGAGLVFPGKRGGEIPVQAFTKLLRDAGLDCTAHGFRSSFRDWCGETGKPRELAEAALAHVVGGVEGAYARSSLFDRRRELMKGWAGYVGQGK